MKKLLATMIRTSLVALMLVIVGAGSSYGLSYFSMDDFDGPFRDAEKSPSNTEDDNLCWAAAASNVLSWTGWGNVYSNSEDEIFSYFQDHWTDQGGIMEFGWEWWMNGINYGQGWNGWSQVDVAGGGFFPEENFFDYYFRTADDNQALAAIDGYLHSGYGVALGIYGPGGHAITAWGYEYDQAGNYRGIYITDSDDQKYMENAQDSLRYYDVLSIGGRWYLQNYYGSNCWYIGEVMALDRYPGANSDPVPEPATIFLFGVGLCGLGRYQRIMRRKKQ